MAAASVVRALAAGSRSLSLDNAGLDTLPAAVSRLSRLCSLSAKNNSLRDLPNEIVNLRNLVVLNLGGNRLSHMPDCLEKMSELQTLHLFGNSIESLDDKILKGLCSLRLLNLNNNLLEELSKSIIHLLALQQLSITNNRLCYLPLELCQLHTLRELHLVNNQIDHLPNNIGALKQLRKLYVQKNKLLSLPQSLGECVSLQVLDVSCNLIELFPTEIQILSLTEFHYEQNPLLPPIPLPAEQITEVLSLKELTARYIVKTMESDSELAMVVGSYEQIRQHLQNSGECAVCSGPFIDSWLECVEFISVKKASEAYSTNSDRQETVFTDFQRTKAQRRGNDPNKSDFMLSCMFQHRRS